MSKFGENLKRFRKAKRMTLDELAEDINKKYGTKMAKGTISRWEHGTDTTVETINILADYFNVSLNEMMGITTRGNDVKVVDTFIPIFCNFAIFYSIFHYPFANK